jgi:shikimate kinase
MIFLIGYRGTGKTSVAAHVARRLGWDWIDADVELEQRAGKSIAEMFATEGEAAFRDLEATILAELAARERLVVAAGGGVVLRPENREILKSAAARSRGCVVWLKAEPATILRRLAGDATTAGRRPNLTTAGGEAEVLAMLAERTPLYEQCAGLVVDTEGRSPDQIAQEILTRLKLSEPS